MFWYKEQTDWNYKLRFYRKKIIGSYLTAKKPAHGFRMESSILETKILHAAVFNLLIPIVDVFYLSEFQWNEQSTIFLTVHFLEVKLAHLVVNSFGRKTDLKSRQISLLFVFCPFSANQAYDQCKKNMLVKCVFSKWELCRLILWQEIPEENWVRFLKKNDVSWCLRQIRLKCHETNQKSSYLETHWRN